MTAVAARRASLAYCALASCALASCALSSCAEPPLPPPAPDSGAGLRASLAELQGLCALKPEEGRARLKELTLSRDEALALFSRSAAEGLEELSPPPNPSPRAVALAAHYAQDLAPRFVEEGCEELARAYHMGWRDVGAAQVGPNQGEHNAPGDLALLLALPARPALYVARWHAPGVPLGLRVSGFVWAGGRWRALLKAGELLEPWRADDLKRAEERAGESPAESPAGSPAEGPAESPAKSPGRP